MWNTCTLKTKMLREIADGDDTNKLKDIPCSWIRRILLKYAYYQNQYTIQHNSCQN